MRQQRDGRETWQRLREWDKGQTPSERLAAQILLSDKYTSVDPIHPLGGKDGLKDILCEKDGLKFIVACYFPRGQRSFSELNKKFISDMKGIAENEVNGFVFITNQELRLGERDKLVNLVTKDKILDLFHLERITALLNSPINYGTRLEYLDIEMSKEEQISYMHSKDQIILDLVKALHERDSYLKSKKDTFSKPSSVSPERIITYEMFGLNSISPFHRCLYCGYGFKIEGYGTIYQIPHGQRKIELVTCPECGNTDNI